MSNAKNKLVIIDGNAIIHRSYHALPPLTKKDGTVVNAVYGFASILLKVMQELAPTHLVVTFDLPGGTFRDEIYTEYKATRTTADQDLYDQIPLVHEVVEAFNIPIFEVAGFEADDVIGTITAQTKQNTDNIIVTGDMDALQLVNENTTVHTLRKGISDIAVYDAAGVVERTGLEPNQIVDLKSIQGDSSDNIPGVRGIGIKGATDLLQKFSTLEGVLEAAKDESSDMKPSIRAKLLEGKEDALMSEQLAKICTDVPLKFSLRDAALHTTDWQRVADVFAEFEFTSLLRRLPKEARAKVGIKIAASKKTKIAVINEKKEIDDLLRRAHESKVIGLNLLPQGSDRITSDIAAAVLCVEKDGYVVPFDKCDQEQKNSVINLLQTDMVVGHDLKQLLVLVSECSTGSESGINSAESKSGRPSTGSGTIQGAKLFDVMVASYLLDPGTRAHDVEAIALKRLGVHLDTSKREGLFGADYEQAARELCAMTSLHQELKGELKKVKLLPLFEEIEMPLIPVLARMEKYGVKVDEKTLAALSKKVAEGIKNLTKQIHKLAGEEFNISSSQQLREILFVKLSLPTFNIKKGKTGYSTAAAELEKLRDQHEIIPLIEEYRELAKLQSTYTDALPNLINIETGRIHTSFNQTVTATGRLSSSDPNLQNIPIRTDLGRQIRDAFIAEKGNVLLALDYSQIELRIAATLAKDKKMIEAFNAGHDIHTATAAAINGVPIEKVTKDMRFAAKAVNFGILYGMGAFGLAWRAGMAQFEARDFITKYFNAFSGVKKYIDDTIANARDKGYVETMFGRRRYIPELNAGNANVRQAGERMAVNHPIQGTSADITKKAMIEVDALIRREWPEDVTMILQVHDELVFEVTEKFAKKVAPKLQEIMQDVVELEVPVEVTIGVGKNWGAVK